MCNIYKAFELCQMSLHNFLCQNVLIFPLYILLARRIDTFWSEVVESLWSRVTGYFEPVNHTRKISNIHRDLSMIPTFYGYFSMPNYAEISFLHTIYALLMMLTT